MPYGTVNADVIGTSVTGSNIGAGNASIMKNRIINGAMVIDQRNAGASVTPTTTAYTLDRWIAGLSVTSKYSVQQNAGSVTPPVGFTNYLGVTSLSAYTVGSAEQFNLSQRIEGFNTADLGWGTANAKTVTLSFWVYSSLTGTFGGSLKNSAVDRSYPFTYTISSANTWEQKSVTIAGDTSGTWLTTNGIGISLNFGLGVGSTFSGTAGAWAGANYTSATGATSVVGTNGATFFLTGVQLEVGSFATGFEYRQYQQELALCQRYLPMIRCTGTGTRQMIGTGMATSGTTTNLMFPFSVTARTLATGITVSNATRFGVFGSGGGTITSTAISWNADGTSDTGFVSIAVAAGLTAGDGTLWGFTTAATSSDYILFTGCEL